MKYIDAELLRKEIEFAKFVYSNPKRVVHGVADAFMQDGRAAMCDDILKKLDTLEEPLSEDLEEAAEAYAYTNWEDNDYHEGASEGLPFDAIGHTEKCFKAGAEWQYQKDRGKFAQIKAKTWCEGYDACKAKMIEDAVEGEVCILPGRAAYVEEKDNESLKQYLLDHFKSGDKVRIIIVKEEEE